MRLDAKHFGPNLRSVLEISTGNWPASDDCKRSIMSMMHKAPSNDIQVNLQAPLAGIRHELRATGTVKDGLST